MRQTVLKSFVCTAAMLAVVFTSMAMGAETPSIRSLMTDQEFRDAGLGKLSEQEMEALDRWLVRYTVKDAPELMQHNPEIREEIKKSVASGIRSRIAGEFRGWSGDTLFYLENGQVWKQRLPGRWSTLKTSPEVEIRKNVLGFWVMRVIEDGKSIGVTRSP